MPIYQELKEQKKEKDKKEKKKKKGKCKTEKKKIEGKKEGRPRIALLCFVWFFKADGLRYSPYQTTKIFRFSPYQVP